jgi:putative mRNA 3-end processing factor
VEALVQATDDGLYCAAGNFHVDPWRPVERAAVTHAHADHACAGSRSYLAAQAGVHLLRARVGSDAAIEPLAYGRAIDVNGVRVSFHPAGHILGSAQVRLEHRGEVWVISGDYKLDPDPTCDAFESLRCHTFVTESTFGLPIYRWPAPAQVFQQIHAWWRHNQDAGKTSVLFAYALGKAQRVLAGIDPAIGPVYTHGAVEQINRLYRDAGVAIAETRLARTAPAGTDWTRALVIAPPMSASSPWLRRFGAISTGLASGWMRIRGTRRRRSLDRGFVISDHADWPRLMRAIEASGAEKVWVTHGYRAPVVRWLREKGLDAQAVETRYEGERDEGADETAAVETT